MADISTARQQLSMTSGTTELVNIGPKETRKRLFLGVAMVAVGVVLAAVLS